MNIRSTYFQRPVEHRRNYDQPVIATSEPQDQVSFSPRAPKKHVATGAFATLGLAAAVGMTGVLTESLPALYIAGGIVGGVLATTLITRASEELHSL